MALAAADLGVGRVGVDLGAAAGLRLRPGKQAPAGMADSIGSRSRCSMRNQAAVVTISVSSINNAGRRATMACRRR